MFIYAVGGAHPYREPCQKIIDRAGDGELVGEASVDLIQEFLHQRTRRTGDRAEAVRGAGLISELCRLHDVEQRDLPLAYELFVRHPSLDARDALFAAVAQNRGIAKILSSDRAFDDVSGIERVDPADAAAVDALAR